MTLLTCSEPVLSQELHAASFTTPSDKRANVHAGRISGLDGTEEEGSMCLPSVRQYVEVR